MKKLSLGMTILAILCVGPARPARSETSGSLAQMDFYHVTIKTINILKPIDLHVEPSPIDSNRSFTSPNAAGHCWIHADQAISAIPPGLFSPMTRWGHDLVEPGITPKPDRKGPNAGFVAFLDIFIDHPDLERPLKISCYSSTGLVTAGQLIDTFDGVMQFEFEPIPR